jgi:MFS family permease
MTQDIAAPDTRRYVLIAAILASSMGFIDGSVISIAIPAIRADLGASLSEAQWVSNGYLLLLSSSYSAAPPAIASASATCSVLALWCSS